MAMKCQRLFKQAEDAYLTGGVMCSSISAEPCPLRVKYEDAENELKDARDAYKRRAEKL
jgi:hypothetical protein